MSAAHSPWWAHVASEMHLYAGDVVFTIEEIAKLVPSYPDGRRPRERAVARRLLELNVIELVERGPNGSLGKGAKYKILPESPSPPAGAVDEIIDNTEFLEDAVERMTRPRSGRKIR